MCIFQCHIAYKVEEFQLLDLITKRRNTHVSNAHLLLSRLLVCLFFQISTLIAEQYYQQQELLLRGGGSSLHAAHCIVFGS